MTANRIAELRRKTLEPHHAGDADTALRYLARLLDEREALLAALREIKDSVAYIEYSSARSVVDAAIAKAEAP